MTYSSGPGERCMALLTSGNLGSRQSCASCDERATARALERDLHARRRAAVGDAVRKVYDRDSDR